MQTVIIVLIGLAVVAFLLAVAQVFTGPIMGIQARSFSSACTNLALIAIALSVVFN